jgi:hypothetical protein
MLFLKVKTTMIQNNDLGSGPIETRYILTIST